jgi:hypothetical protein
MTPLMNPASVRNAPASAPNSELSENRPANMHPQAIRNHRVLYNYVSSGLFRMPSKGNILPASELPFDARVASSLCPTPARWIATHTPKTVTSATALPLSRFAAFPFTLENGALRIQACAENGILTWCPRLRMGMELPSSTGISKSARNWRAEMAYSRHFDWRGAVLIRRRRSTS